jgi:hypothetical protein
MAYLICCEYPAHPPADGSSIAKGSADTALFVTLLFACCSFPFGPGFVVCWCLNWNVAAVGEWHYTVSRTLRESPILHTHHNTTLYSHPQTLTPRENKKVRRPNSGLKFVIKEVCIIAQTVIFTCLLYSQQRYHKHAKLKSLTTHCQPACHTDNLPGNLEITRLRIFSLLLTVGIS